MPSTNGDGSYRIAFSEAISDEARRLQRQASREGRGPAFLAAFRKITERLQDDPTNFGDPNYRLPALRLQLRTAIVPPILVHFAVSEDRPEVYIKALKLL